MAFFQNTKPNAVAGISLPADGSEAMSIHLINRNPKGSENTSYTNDLKFFSSLRGARTIETSSGCIIEFCGQDNILHVLAVSVDFFDGNILSEVCHKRDHAMEDALRFLANKDLSREPALYPKTTTHIEAKL